MAASTQHPLDPLTPSEISESSRLIKATQPIRNWIFNSISLKEPLKHLVLSPKIPLESIPRRAFNVLLEKGTGKLFEGIVNLTEKKVESLVEIHGDYQPNMSPEDCHEAERIALADEEVKRRAKALGLDMSQVFGDAWATGYLADKPELLGPGKRLIMVLMYTRMFDEDNMYAHPLNFSVISDVISGKVVAIDDLPIHSAFDPIRKNEVKIPRTPWNHDPDLLDKDFFRKDLKPLQVLQPEGPSFKVTGNLIEWQKFKIRFGFNFREGLVLHTVSYQDGEKLRPLLYRASLAEMIVPYADPRPPYHRKCALDAGDCGLGFMATSLELGCDCLGTIQYFDGVMNTHAGDPMIIKNAICLHEEDAGMLFKHVDYKTGKVSVARSRRLVLSFVAAIVNYDYGFYWSFYQDGTIGFEVKATGNLSATLLADGETTGGFGTIVAPNINAQYHQHIFGMRIDPMLDGVNNTISTVDVKPLDAEVGSKGNPYGQGFTVQETVLKTTKEAITDSSPNTSRVWKISNESSINEITKEPVAWKLMSNNNYRLMAKPGSYVWDKGAFARHALWVTPYDDEQKYPGGFYVFNKQSNWTDDGLVAWTKEEKNVQNTDVVLWHSFGICHIPRIEDFPIMPVETAGFMLKPHNFFNANPGLDVPPPNKKENASKSVTENGCCH